MSTAEACEKWGVSLRQVQRLMADNRLPDAKKYGRSWMIPADAKRPIDKRKERRLPQRTLSEDLLYVYDSTAVPMPVHDPDAILKAMTEDRLRLIYQGELAYLRGDFRQSMDCFHRTQGDDSARLRVCPMAIAAAISAGDYRTYTEIDAYLKNCVREAKDSQVIAVAELSLATVAVSVIAPNMAPDWLKEGDISALPSPIQPNALYLRAKYFSGLSNFEAMLAVAETALSLCSSRQGISHHDIYLRMMCAVACRYLQRNDEARRWLLDAMGIALPHGFITPFSELVTAFGGMMELCLKQEFPAYYDAVIDQWKRTWKNWIIFHNQFTQNNMTVILSLREHHIASLVAQRVPYAKIAKRYGISVGRVKNIMLEVYSKLRISGRDELSKYVFP